MNRNREQIIDQEVFWCLLHHGEWSVEKLRENPNHWGFEQYNGTELNDSIHRLRVLGCNILSTPDGLHRMVQSGLGIWEDYLRESLASRNVHFPLIRIYQETSSTQDVAKAFAPGRTLILANHQSAGRGRLGRSWVSEPGSNVLMSISWPESESLLTHDRVSLLAGVAVGQAVLEHLPDVSLRYKWPNDIMIGIQKLAGILIEYIDETYIIGIGLNVKIPSTLDSNARELITSLQSIGFDKDRLMIITEIASRLAKLMLKHDVTDLVEQWRRRAALGQTHTFRNHGQRITGEVLDLDPDHGLIVRRDTGEIITLPAATTSVVS